MVAQCAIVAKRECEDEVCAKTSGANIRRKVLQPAASRFRQKNGLQDVTSDEALLLLVESLRYAIFEGYKRANTDEDYSANRLMTRRGVLVDNTVFVDAAIFNKNKFVQIMFSDDEQVQDDLPQPQAAVAPEPSVRNDQTSRATSVLVACCPKNVGRYSISAAMVVVLSNLMFNAFEEKSSNIGDMFQRAVAKFLFITTQVFHGRPVHELVDFIVGPFAIIGAKALAVVRAANVVVFRSLDLRMSARLNADALALSECAQSQKAATAKAQFAKLWKSESRSCAWIEVSPASLPSADIVLHIPGVITLAFQCKDAAPYEQPNDAAKAFSSIKQPGIYARKLLGLGAPVVPILYMTRAEHNTSADVVQETETTTQCQKARKKAVGNNCIFSLAEGLGEPELKFPSDYIDANAQLNDVRLHNVRRTIMQFEFRRKERDDVEEVTRVDNVHQF